MDFFSFIQREGQPISKQVGEHVFMQGQQDPALYLILEGTLKAYYVTEDGQERVKSFLVANDVIGSMSAAYKKEATTFGLVCLSETKLLRCDFDLLYQQSQHDHQLASQMLDILLAFAMKKEKREREFLCLSAEQRYLNLLETNPKLLQQVTQNDIARYLGVTPVGLSRIKQRVQRATEVQCSDTE